LYPHETGKANENEWEYNEAVHQLFIDFKKAYDSVRREVFYNILNEFCIPMKLIRLIKMCLTETYSRVWVCNNLSDMLPIRNGLLLEVRERLLPFSAVSVVFQFSI
jgi:hypothetical protein